MVYFHDLSTDKNVEERTQEGADSPHTNPSRIALGCPGGGLLERREIYLQAGKVSVAFSRRIHVIIIAILVAACALVFTCFSIPLLIMEINCHPV